MKNKTESKCSMS